MSLKSVLLLAFALTSTQAGILFDPCFKDDLKCLQTATENFLSKTYGGSSNFGFKPIDPLIISSIDISADDDMGLVFYFKNANVTGLRNLKISDFKMDTDKKSVLLKMKADINIVSDFKVGLTKLDKQFNGLYTASATVFGKSQYSYSLKDINGTEYFEVGTETNSCEIVDEPNVTLGGELPNTLSSDQDAIRLRPEWEAKKSDIRKKTICEIANQGFATIMHNLRVSAQAFPKSAFFKDI